MTCLVNRHNLRSKEIISNALLLCPRAPKRIDIMINSVDPVRTVSSLSSVVWLMKTAIASGLSERMDTALCETNRPVQVINCSLTFNVSFQTF